jgi:hypothetical protein
MTVNSLICCNEIINEPIFEQFWVIIYFFVKFVNRLNEFENLVLVHTVRSYCTGQPIPEKRQKQ